MADPIYYRLKLDKEPSSRFRKPRPRPPWTQFRHEIPRGDYTRQPIPAPLGPNHDFKYESKQESKQESIQETKSKYTILVPASILSRNQTLYRLQCRNLFEELLKHSLNKDNKRDFPGTSPDPLVFRKDLHCISRLEYVAQMSMWQFTFELNTFELNTLETPTRFKSTALESKSSTIIVRSHVLSGIQFSSDDSKTWRDYFINRIHDYTTHPTWAIVAWLLLFLSIDKDWANQIRSCYSV